MRQAAEQLGARDSLKEVVDPEQAPDLDRARALVHVAAPPGLEHAPFADNDDLIGQHRCLLRIVGDDHCGEVDLVLEPSQLAPQLTPHGCVQRGERLVQQDDARVHGQRTCKADALPLPAGELLWQPVT